MKGNADGPCVTVSPSYRPFSLSQNWRPDAASPSGSALSPGTRLLASQGPSQILFQRFQKSVFSQWTSAMLVSAKDLQILLADHSCEEAPPIGSQLN